MQRKAMVTASLQLTNNHFIYLSLLLLSEKCILKSFHVFISEACDNQMAEEISMKCKLNLTLAFDVLVLKSPQQNQDYFVQRCFCYSLLWEFRQQQNLWIFHLKKQNWSTDSAIAAATLNPETTKLQQLSYPWVFVFIIRIVLVFIVIFEEQANFQMCQQICQNIGLPQMT